MFCLVSGEVLAHRWWGSDRQGSVAVALHGITANSLAWQPVAEASTCPVLAPDLRGRGRSRHLPGPFGLARHVDDVITLMDAEGLDRVVLAGHSMGAYVAALTAARHPARIERVVLVDGGLSLGTLPDDADPDAVLAATLGPALARLEMHFSSVAGYLDMWRGHPAFTEWEPFYDAYFASDLGSDGTPLAAVDAVRSDGRDLLTNAELQAAPHRIACPLQLVWAERGLLDQPDPLIAVAAAQDFVTAHAGAHFQQIRGSNHYSILMSAEHAIAVARVVSGLA
jgi:pimeloyl-ACP methyl ester carboxylesterase